MADTQQPQPNGGQSNLTLPEARRSTGKVTVACKMPNGLIMELTEPVKTQEPVMGGGSRQVTMHRRTGQRYTLFGPAAPFGMAAKAPVAGGYALNFGVPADFFATWMEQNKNSDLVRNHMVFAHESNEYVSDMAKERADLRSGLEPLLQAKDPRVPSAVQTFNGKTSE